MLAAVFAAVSHWLMIFALSDGDATAVTANRLTSPTAGFEELPRRFLVRKLLEEFEGAERFWFRLHFHVLIS